MTTYVPRGSRGFGPVSGGSNGHKGDRPPADRVSAPRPASRLRLLLLAVVGSLTISGCGFDVYKLPLPGGTDVGDDPITVHVMFRTVLPHGEADGNGA